MNKRNKLRLFRPANGFAPDFTDPTHIDAVYILGYDRILSIMKYGTLKFDTYSFSLFKRDKYESIRRDQKFPTKLHFYWFH